jgi:hypothetical protein
MLNNHTEPWGEPLTADQQEGKSPWQYGNGVRMMKKILKNDLSLIGYNKNNTSSSINILLPA